MSDDCRRRIIRDNLVELIRRLHPAELLPHLTCLSIQAKQKIRCRLENEGQVSASTLLLEELPRKDRWWEQFMAALRHPLVDMDDVADLLEANIESLSETHINKNYLHNKEKYKRKEKIDWSTPLDKLPYTVVQILKKLDVDSKWKDLAAHLEYTVEEVGRFEVYTDKDGSHVTKFYHDLAKNPAFNLEQLVCILREMERKDILEDLRHIKELRHLDWDSYTTMAFTESASQSHLLSYPLEVTTIARQESSQGESELYVASRNSNSIPTDVSPGSNGSHAEKDEKNTSGVTLGGTQLMSMDTSAAIEGPAQLRGDTDNCAERIVPNNETDDMGSVAKTQGGHINEYFDNNNYPPKGNTQPFPEDSTTNEGSTKTGLCRRQEVGNTVPFSAQSSNLNKTVIGIAATGLIAYLVLNLKR
ncbi:uncharacterized protein LOC133181427 [Saccostrea echinata]|uniref:uncharacterized protein LOC133181427 n=1 Tax=Saccostrea echinata TaxID=191078 RepID=UPI002A82475E|nr:uncharacterized protein LOC133181427 [Saccostrea echinata]